jgi:transcriptional regulator with XRE-family HTH domain
LTSSRISISELLGRVIEMARQAVQAGEISERALARRAGLSQPHLHNALKGVRALSPAAADQLMRALDVAVPQLLWLGTDLAASEIRAVPLLQDRIGPGSEASLSVFRGYLPLPAPLVAPLEDPVAAYLAADLALPSEFRFGDLALHDRNAARRILPEPGSCWVVADNAGLRVRYVRRSGGTLELGTAPNAAGVRVWRTVSLHGRDILEIVRARIVWIGREMEAPPAGTPGPAGSGY